MPTAYLALGANLGDRAAQLEAARQGIDHLPGTRLIARSRDHETEPVGPPDQPKYLNAAVGIETTLTPRELLAHLLAIETRAGRQRAERWGPRRIDLDILLYDDRVIDEPGLTVPHPRMHERRFVLDPLNEIAAEVLHPVLGRTVRQLREALPDR